MIQVILNPYANRWKAGRRRAQVEQALQAAGVAYTVAVTIEPRQATLLAETAVREGATAVVAAGGDGTISEVVNGLIRASGDGPTVPLGIMPVGSANDFGEMVHIPRDLAAAAQVIAAGKTRRIDAGRVNDHYFNNNSAVAMEPMITLEQIAITRVSGELRYLLALVKGLLKLKAWQMKITWDGGGYDGPAYLLSVCNSPRTGGFDMAPGAKVDDGWLDVVFAPEIPRRQVLAVLFGLLRGEHIRHPAVTFVRTRTLALTSSPGTPLHADGEVLGGSFTAVEYAVLPGKLTLLTP